MKNHTCIFILFCSLIILPGYYVYSETGVMDNEFNFEYFKFKTEIYKLDEIRNRIDFKFGFCRFLYVDVRNSDGPVHNSFGFSFPWVTAGPLIVKGLLREIYNPLGYSVTSSVFREKTDINLSSSFSNSGRNGLILEIVPDVLGFYQYESAEISKFGGFISYRNDLSAEILFNFSEPDADEVPDSWFLETPVFPGGMLSHTAFRLSFKKPLFFIFLSAGFSGGKLVRPGYFTNTVLMLRNDFVEIGGLVGITSEYYFNPDGKNSNYHTSYYADIWIKAFDPLFFGGEYWSKKEHPGFIIDLYTESREGYLIKSRINMDFNKRYSIVLNSEFSNKYNYNDNGDTEIEESVDSNLIFTLYKWKCGCYHEISFIDDEITENNLEINVQYAFNSTKISAAYNHSIFEHTFTGWSISCITGFGNFKTNITAGMDYYDFYLTLGWELIIK